VFLPSTFLCLPNWNFEQPAWPENRSILLRVVGLCQHLFPILWAGQVNHHSITPAQWTPQLFCIYTIVVGPQESTTFERLWVDISLLIFGFYWFFSPVFIFDLAFCNFVFDSLVPRECMCVNGRILKSIKITNALCFRQ